jgi:integral membrane protein
MTSFFNIFRIVAFFEGLSFILLLFFATPMKYYADNESYVKILGMPHGILFLIYLIMAFMLRSEHKWIKKNFVWVTVAAVIPFGTFVLEHKMPKA